MTKPDHAISKFDRLFEIFYETSEILEESNISIILYI